MEPEDPEEPQRSSSRLPIALSLALTLVVVGVLASSASAQNTTQITIEAREDCAETTFCFEITGNLEEAEPGDILDITFENPEDNLQPHNVHLALSSEANVGEEESTEPRVAFANTEDISPGNETTLSAQIPEDAEGVYLWCSIRAHEQQGMYREAQLAGTGDGGGTNGSPGFGALAGVAVLALAGLARRRS